MVVVWNISAKKELKRAHELKYTITGFHIELSGIRFASFGLGIPADHL